MTTFLYAVLILDGLFMTVVVLLQAGKGGGLAAVGGSAAMTEGILAGRQATTLLTRATWISGSLFLSTSLALSIISQRNAAPTSVIDVPPPAMQAPVPILEGGSGLLPDDAQTDDQEMDDAGEESGTGNQTNDTAGGGSGPVEGSGSGDADRIP